jgi:hypothetical protein
MEDLCNLAIEIEQFIITEGLSHNEPVGKVIELLNERGLEEL